jgi:hypothetical protein
MTTSFKKSLSRGMRSETKISMTKGLPWNKRRRKLKKGRTVYSKKSSMRKETDY